MPPTRTVGTQALGVGFACVGLTLLLMAASRGTFFYYVPLLVASLTCGILALVERRIAGGVMLLVSTVVVPPVVWLALAAVSLGWLVPPRPESPPVKPVSGAPRASAEVRRFQVTAARLFMDITVDPREPVLEVSVRNGTTRRIARASFVATSSTPELLPVATQTLDYDIPDTLGPGEAATWQFSLARGSPWADAATRGGLVLTIDITRLDTADGEALVPDGEASSPAGAPR